jgi:hypothetical protein
MEMLKIDSFSEQENRRFQAKIQIDDNTGCWNWTGSKDAAGYGLCFFRGKTERIHRVMFAMHIGPVPRGKARCDSQVHHKCRNTSCCNPGHLQLVSQRQNVLEGVSPVALNARKTHCKNGHPLPQHANARNGRERVCRTCDNLRHKKRMQGPNSEYWKQKARETAKRWRDRHPGAATAAMQRCRQRKKQAQT